MLCYAFFFSGRLGLTRSSFGLRGSQPKYSYPSADLDDFVVLAGPLLFLLPQTNIESHVDTS